MYQLEVFNFVITHNIISICGILYLHIYKTSTSIILGIYDTLVDTTHSGWHCVMWGSLFLHPWRVVAVVVVQIVLPFQENLFHEVPSKLIQCSGFRIDIFKKVFLLNEELYCLTRVIWMNSSFLRSFVEKPIMVYVMSSEKRLHLLWTKTFNGTLTSTARRENH